MNKSCAQCISHYIYRKRVSIVANKSISTNAYVKNDNYVNNLLFIITVAFLPMNHLRSHYT
jgi:hypothetical protein